MKNHPLPFSKIGLLAISMISFIICVGYYLFKATKGESANNPFEFAFLFGSLAQLIIWFIVLVDIIRNPILNKSFWYIAMLFIGPLTCILYLINREKHLRLYKKLKA